MRDRMGVRQSSTPAHLHRSVDTTAADPELSAAGNQAITRLLRDSASGHPIPAGVRARLQAALGVPLTTVRLHTDAAAASSASAQLGARAFTVGSDIYFGSGQYDGDSPTGFHLLAHEVAHTLQNPTAPATDLVVGAVDSPAEREADQVADKVTTHRSATVSPRPGSVIRREPLASMAEPSLDQRYHAALVTARETGDWRTAAMLLNGFNRADILGRLAELTAEDVSYLHLGALGNYQVGPGSQLAQLTRPSTGGDTRLAGGGIAVANMTATQKLVEAFNRADINTAVRERFLAMMPPEVLVGAIISFAAVFVVSQFTPVGWAADIALLATTLFVGTALIRAANHLINFAAARHATTSEQLDTAGREFARAVAEVEVDAIMFLITRRAGPSGGAPYSGSASGGVVLATTRGQLVLVAAETIPVAVGRQLGVTAGATTMAMASDPRDADYWENTYGDDPLNDQPRRQRISDGHKEELENSGWLKERLPDPDMRREFVYDLRRRYGGQHGHHPPGAPVTERALREWLQTNYPNHQLAR